MMMKTRKKKKNLKVAYKNLKQLKKAESMKELKIMKSATKNKFQMIKMKIKWNVRISSKKLLRNHSQ